MAKPPQARSNPATVADQQAKIFDMKHAGLSHDRIAEQLGISHGTVANRLAAAIRDLVGPPAEEFANAREAELSRLFSVAYREMLTAQGTDTKLKCIDRCLKINESLRKLRGADAPEAMAVSLERRSELEGEFITEALMAALADLPPKQLEYRAALAGRRMIELEGGTPEGPPPEPPPAEEQASPSVPWPVTREGREYVWIRGKYRELGPEYRPSEPEVFDAEFVDDDLTDDQDGTGSAGSAYGRTGPGVPDDDQIAVQRAIEAAQARFPDEDWSDDD